ncbi:GIY-YIG nuclease family protein [Sesbania bispinosa]|nr:GIY-YIG nuclease family protein [Sesbania bispinosa]
MRSSSKSERILKFVAFLECSLSRFFMRKKTKGWGRGKEAKRRWQEVRVSCGRRCADAPPPSSFVPPPALVAHSLSNAATFASSSISSLTPEVQQKLKLCRVSCDRPGRQRGKTRISPLSLFFMLK